MHSEFPNIFEISQIILNRNRCAKNFDSFSHIKNLSTERLIERILEIKTSFSKILDIGCHNGEVAKFLKKNKINFQNLTQSDYSLEFLKNSEKYGNTSLLINEILPFEEEEFDMVLSSFFLHWINDLYGFLKQINLIIRPGGVFIGALAGGDSLIELRNSITKAETEISGGNRQRFSPMINIKDLGMLLQRANFDLTVVDSEKVKIIYKNIFDIMYDLRGMGEQNTTFNRNKFFTNKKLFNLADQIYRNNYVNNEGKLLNTIEIIFFIGWKKIK